MKPLVLAWLSEGDPHSSFVCHGASARKHQGSEKVSLGITRGIVLKGKPSEEGDASREGFGSRGEPLKKSSFRCVTI